MNLGLLLPEIRLVFWIVLSIILINAYLLPAKFIQFKGKDYVLAAGNTFMVISYAIITSLYIIFYSSAGLIINFDFFVSLLIAGTFLYLTYEYSKVLPKKFIYVIFIIPLIISFLVFYYLYNGEKIYKLSPHCRITDKPNIIYCEYSNGNYTGEMKSFRRHGHGEYIWNSGKTYKGKWKKGKKVKKF